MFTKSNPRKCSALHNHHSVLSLLCCKLPLPLARLPNIPGFCFFHLSHILPATFYVLYANSHLCKHLNSLCVLLRFYYFSEYIAYLKFSQWLFVRLPSIWSTHRFSPGLGTHSLATSWCIVCVFCLLFFDKLTR